MLYSSGMSDLLFQESQQTKILPSSNTYVLWWSQEQFTVRKYSFSLDSYLCNTLLWTESGMSRQLSPERPAGVGLNSQCWLISSLLVQIQKAFHQESSPAAIHITVFTMDPHLNCSDATGLPIWYS